MTGEAALVAVAVALPVVFAAAWVLAMRIGNQSIVDAVWALAIGAAAVFWLATGDGDAGVRLAAGMVGILWSARLGGHLVRRIRRMHPIEDARYEKLREVWRGREGVAFFWFFQVQALSVFLLALPFFAVGRGAAGWGIFEVAGLGVVACGIIGESVADRQLAAFKRRTPDRGAVCRDGMWRYSRHPNYFFESVVWWGFFLIACGSPWGWATVHAPLAISWLLVRVTGIPPTEAAAVAAKGEAYREYQRTTSAFIPLPPKIQNSKL
jgi:steroid 5-alpha reductase family enzyme